MTQINAVVTGASRGIGRAIAHRLHEDGFRVFNLDITPPPESASTDSEWVDVDLSDPSAIQLAFDAVQQQGPISVLINNAGLGGEMDLLENASAADLDRIYGINVRAPALCAKHAVAGMKDLGSGRIINIASRAHLGKAYRTAYGGSKGALVSMTRVWAIELAAAGITCNAVAPGPVRTELFDKANPPDMPRTQQIIDGIPVGRIGLPVDIAHAVSYFADVRSSYVTGQVLYVCGGTMLTRGGS